MTKLKLIKKFKTMEQNRQLRILWEAIDYMNQYNGRSRLETVAMATADELKVEYEV